MYESLFQMECLEYDFFTYFKSHRISGIKFKYHGFFLHVCIVLGEKVFVINALL